MESAFSFLTVPKVPTVQPKMTFTVGDAWSEYYNFITRNFFFFIFCFYAKIMS
jgi:hypothetical protein